MKTFENMQSWIARRKELKQHGQTIGLIPTMGALHSGHISLINKARDENDFVVASIFVNPTQFNNKEDLEKYPRSLESDLGQLKNANVDAVLLPTENELYEDQYQFRIIENKISKILCGSHRPGHFAGVLTVVAKLIGLTQARRCYFGEKDYQQLLLIEQMARALFIDTEIIAAPTVREESGLAMSSRNLRLSATGRTKASLLYKYLSSESSCAEVLEKLAADGFEVEYVEEHWGRRFAAASIEGVRLIDNVKI